MKQMQYSCTLNTPMAFYGDAFGLENMLAARGDAQPPALGATEVNFSSLEPCASHGDMMRQNPTFWTHPRDCPSISLGCVWDGKISILSRAAREHPDYDLYAWVDVGMHASGTSRDVFRSHDRKPWPHPKKLAMLTLEKLFYRKLQECVEYWEHRDRVYIEGDNAYFGGYGCLSEQMILSVIARNQPRLFNWVGQGWGRIAANLTTDAMDFAERDSGAEDILGWLASGDDEGEGSSAAVHRLAAGPAVRVKVH